MEIVFLSKQFTIVAGAVAAYTQDHMGASLAKNPPSIDMVFRKQTEYNVKCLLSRTHKHTHTHEIFGKTVQFPVSLYPSTHIHGETMAWRYTSGKFDSQLLCSYAKH